MTIVYCEPWGSQIKTIRIRHDEKNPALVKLVFEGGYSDEPETFEMNVWGKGFGPNRKPPEIVDERPGRQAEPVTHVEDFSGEYDDD